MTRHQGIVLSSALLLMLTSPGFGECRRVGGHSQGSVFADAEPAIHAPDLPADLVAVAPTRSAERGGLTQRPVMLMAGVGIALGLLIRTVKLRSV